MDSVHQAFQSMGLDAHCSFIDAKQRYRQLAKELHPDRVSDPQRKARAERDMKRLNADFELIEVYFAEAKKNPKVQPTTPPKQPSANASDTGTGTSRPKNGSAAGTDSTQSQMQRNASSNSTSTTSSKHTERANVDSNGVGTSGSASAQDKRTAESRSTDPQSKPSSSDSKSAQQTTAKPKSNTSKNKAAANQFAEKQSQERTTQDAARAIWRNRMAFQQADQQKKKPIKRTVESFILRENLSPTDK